MKSARLSKTISLLCAVAVGITGGTAAEPASPVPAAPASTNTATVTRAPGQTPAQLDAVVEAVAMVPVQVMAKAWVDLTMLEAVPHGARVKKGDQLIKLDLDKLRDQVADREQDRPGFTIALQLATAELDNLRQTTPLKLDAAKRVQRVASEDLAYFEKAGRAQKEKATQYSVKTAQQRLDNEAEELKQLQKMYKADDLVEETEEIILKRQKFSVEYAEYSLEAATQAADWNLKTVIPREAEFFQAQRRDQDLALSLAELTLPGALTKKQFDVEKLKRDQAKADKYLADLKADLANLEVRAPAAGIVYYGSCELGKWTTGAVVAKKLVPGGKLTPNELVMTIVDPDKLRLKAVIQEADLGKFKPGMDGHAALVSAPDRKFAVKLEEIGVVPLLTGGFEARLSLTGNPPGHAMPGLNCKITFGDSPAALVAPRTAVFGEGAQRYVFVAKADGQREKRTIKTGLTVGQNIQVLEGLAEGEKILLTKPE